MQDPAASEDLAAFVAAAEARIFVGRRDELRRFPDLLAATRDHPGLAYVYGPSGIGKSALLRAYDRTARALGMAVVAMDGGLVEHSPEGLLRGLAQAASSLNPASPPVAAAAPAIVAALNAAARAGGLVLAIDAYEKLRSCDRWLRGTLLTRLGPGTCLILASRLAPSEAWPGEPAWQEAIQRIALRELGREDALELLRLRGIRSQNTCEEILALAAGQPLLLHLAADICIRRGSADDGARVLRQVGRTTRATLAAEMIERWASDHTHTAPEVGAVLAAAAQVRSFDRPLLEAMLGEATVARAWDALAELPATTQVGGRYALHDAVREPIRDVSRRNRPWTVHRCRTRAIAYCLRRAAGMARGDDDGSCWDAITDLAAHTLWHTWLHPAAEGRIGWHFERGATREDLPGVLACLRATLSGVFYEGRREGVPPDVFAWGERLVSAHPEALLLARGTSGEILGYCASLAWTQATAPFLLGHPLLGQWLSTLSDRERTDWDGRLLACMHLCLLHPDVRLSGALLREVCADYGRYDRVAACTGIPELAHMLGLLNFRRVDGWSTTLPGSSTPAAHTYLLDLGGTAYAQWLSSLVSVPPREVVGPQVRATAAKEVLEALRDDAPLEQTAAAAHFAALFPGAHTQDLRNWVLDALSNCDLAHGPAAVVLHRYYVLRSGSHQAVAAALGLPQRTYFRRLHEGLAELGTALFS